MIAVAVATRFDPEAEPARTSGRDSQDAPSSPKGRPAVATAVTRPAAALAGPLPPHLLGSSRPMTEVDVVGLYRKLAVFGSAVVLVLTAVVGTEAGGATEGVFATNFVVDVVVRGNPPPGAEITVSAPNSQEPEQRVVALADAAGPADLTIVSGTIFRQLFVLPADDAGADRVTYACTMEGGQSLPTPSSCTAHNGLHKAVDGPHVDAWFQEGAAATAQVTITLTFGRCDGRAATVLLGDGDTPTAGADVIVGTSARNVVDGLGGNDRICGGGGNDSLRGGGGNDRLFGQGGADALNGGPQADLCDGGPQTDTAGACETRRSVP